MDEVQNQARRLRELFHGRYTQDEAMQLLAHYGENAAVCVLQAEPRDINRILGNEDNNQRFSQQEYERVSRLLEGGLESDSEPRQFACRDCERCWWKRVPGRKKVAMCYRCKQKYEPIPRDKEWGTGLFECHNTNCQYEFRAAAIMGVTECVCHKCNHTVSVKRIIPPSNRQDFPPNKDTHDCNGVNCYQKFVCPPECHDCPNAEHDEHRRRPRNYRLQDMMEMELRINRPPNFRPYNRKGRRRNFRRDGGNVGRPGGPDDDSPDDHPHNHGASLRYGNNDLGAPAEDNQGNGEPHMLDEAWRSTRPPEDYSGQNINAEFGGEALEIKMQVLSLRVGDSSQNEAYSSRSSNSEVLENEPDNVEHIVSHESPPNNPDNDDTISETASTSTNGGDYFPDDDPNPPNHGEDNQPKTPLCYHSRSIVPRTAVVRTWSERHISTGSTVTTCLDQISLRTQSVRLAYKMFGDD